MAAKRRRVDLVTARKAAGYTQEALAEALHVDRSSVIRWEAGRYSPVPYLWPKLARLLGVTRERLQELFADVDDRLTPAQQQAHQPTSHAVTLEDMKRRTLMKWGVAATAAASLSASAGTTTVGMVDVRRLQQAAARLHNLDQQHGGDTLWQAALVQVQDGVQLLEHGSYTDTMSQHLLTATGQLHICAGWLALDSGQHEVARSCFGEALAMSRQVGDAQIETRALANLAYQSNMLARPHEALRYAIGAERAAAARGSTALLAVIPQLRLAIGNSLACNASDADRAIGQARHALDRDNNAPEEEWSAFLSHLEVDGIEATCAIELDRPVQAERLLEQTIGSYAKQFARNLAGWRVRLARARLDMGAVDGAVEAAHSALDDLTGEVASWRLTTELDSVAQRLAAYPEVEGVESVLTRYQAVSE